MLSLHNYFIVETYDVSVREEINYPPPSLHAIRDVWESWLQEAKQLFEGQDLNEEGRVPHHSRRDIEKRKRMVDLLGRKQRRRPSFRQPFTYALTTLVLEEYVSFFPQISAEIGIFTLVLTYSMSLSFLIRRALIWSPRGYSGLIWQLSKHKISVPPL